MMKKAMAVLMVTLVMMGSCARRPMNHERPDRRTERRPNHPAPPRDRPDEDRRPNY